ncbi:lysophospholipid acyltransferase family protein [Gemmata sp.]|uniref:lysophospholipid acyltransferase family protein n=1 Tax=Gemmata sp. TaxID=1914242 RepID=UPI003F703CDC
MTRERRTAAKHFVTFAVVRLAVCVVQAVPAAVAMWVADAIAWLLYRYIPARRRVALENVRIAFPDMDADRLVLAMYRHFIRAAVEALLMPRKFHLTNWRSFADLYPGAPLLPPLHGNRPALLVTAHFGNWELAGYLLGVVGFKTHAIARVLDNPYLERYVVRMRKTTGQKIIAKKDDFDRLTAVLRAGGKVATLADQDAGPRGLFVDFFGRPASTHKAVALMAIEFDAVMAVIGVPRVSRAGRAALPGRPGMEGTFYAVEVEDIIDPRDYADRPDAVKAITQRYTAALERLIRRHPEQYFWLHRRWKHQPKAREKPKPAAAAA